MTNNKRNAIILCSLSLVLSIAYGIVGFALLNGYGEIYHALPFVYRFIFIFLPCVLVATTISIFRIKEV